MLKVTIYSTNTCPWCKLEKEYLREHQIDFEDILVDENTDAAQKMIDLSGQRGVPFTVVNDDQGHETHILGFDQAKLNQALNISSNQV